MNSPIGSGPQAAFREQLVAFVPRLRRFCVTLARSIDEGDDLAQATIERALGRIEQWHGETELDRWMFAIARNLFIDQARARQRRGVHQGIEVLDQVPGDDGLQLAEQRSELERARMAIGALPDDQRALVALVIVDGQSYRHAAEVLGIPIGTVMSRIARARRSIESFVHADPAGVSS